jgi:hypothetical protein
MSNGKKLKHGNITVYIDDDDIDVTSEEVPPMGDSEGFHLLEAVANIYFFKKGTDHKEKKNQKDKFKKEIKIEIPIPQKVLDHATVKEKGKKALKLAYFDKQINSWVLFEKQKIDVGKNLGTVRFDEWIKDPPVGWGFPD